MSTPRTDAVDAASYPDPHAHREALRKLARDMEVKIAALVAAGDRMRLDTLSYEDWEAAKSL